MSHAFVSELMKRQETQQHANMKPDGWRRYPTGRHRAANERWRSKPRPTRCSLKQYCFVTSHRYQRWQRRSSATHHLPRSFSVPRLATNAGAWPVISARLYRRQPVAAPRPLAWRGSAMALAAKPNWIASSRSPLGHGRHHQS